MTLEELEPLMQLNAVCYMLATEIGFKPDEDGAIDVNLDDLMILVVERMRRGDQ